MHPVKSFMWILPSALLYINFPSPGSQGGAGGLPKGHQRIPPRPMPRAGRPYGAALLAGSPRPAFPCHSAGSVQRCWRRGAGFIKDDQRQHTARSVPPSPWASDHCLFVFLSVSPPPSPDTPPLGQGLSDHQISNASYARAEMALSEPVNLHRALTLCGCQASGRIIWAGPAASSTQQKDPAQLQCPPLAQGGSN